MLETFVILFLGITTVVQMGNSYDSARIIIPNLKGTETVGSHVIPRHRAFLMFPSADYVSSDGDWLKPPEVKVKGVRRGFYFLDGDEITVTHETEPFDGSVHDAKSIHLLKICPTFGAMADRYLNGTDPDVKKAHMDVDFGKLDVIPMFRGMLASRLTFHSKESKITITATSYRNGAKRSVTLRRSPNTEIWIGNLPDQFFGGLPPQSNAHRHHFLAYYLMSEQPSGCTGVPSHAMGTLEATNMGVTCSNSTYP